MSAFRKFNVLLALFGVLFLFSQTAHAGLILNRPNYTGLNQGLVGYWSFDGTTISGTRANDLSGQGNSGTLTNGPVRVQGKLGQALSFDGSNDYIGAADADSLDFGTATDFSVSAWVTKNSAIEKYLLMKGRDDGGVTEGSFMIKYDNSTGRLRAIVTADTWNFYCEVEGTSNIADGKWHHVLVVVYRRASCTSSDFAIFVDGVRDAVTSIFTSNNTNANMTNGDPLTIGAYNDAGSFVTPWDGSIDELRIYNRALSADEGKRLYRIGATLHTNTQINNDTLKNGLVGYWSFDGTTISGTRASDLSGQGNHGTLTNGPVRVQGKLGQALEFDGSNDNVSTLLTSWPTVSTFSFWAYPRSYGGGGIGGIFNKTSAGVVQIEADGPGSFDRSWAILRTFDGGQAFFGTPNNSVILNAWQHVVIVYDGSSVTNDPVIYINGQSQTVIQEGANPTGSAITNANPFIIGQGYNGASAIFDGFIDDVRLYSRALSADEIKRLYRIGATLHVNTASKNTATDSLKNGLVGHWSFDGTTIYGTKAGDVSGRGNDATLTNGPLRVQGKLGQAMHFDGVNDYASIGGTNLDDINTFTYSTWIYPRTMGEGGFGGIIIKGGADVGVKRFLLNDDCTGDQTVPKGIEISVDRTSGASACSVADTIALNTWQFITVTYSGTDGPRIYKNGTEVSYVSRTVGSGAETSDAGAGLLIGDWYRDANGEFSGYIDDVRIYNRVLTRDEIKRLYNLGR